MSKVRNLYAKYWRNFHFAIILILSLFFITANEFVNPYLKQVVYSVFYSPFSSVNNYFSNLTILSEKNERLNLTLVDLSVRLSLYEERNKENERLRKILGFDQLPEYDLIPTEVVSVYGDFIPVTATINKGSNDSIAVDMAVVNQQGLIGRISSVAPEFAVVQLLTEPTNRVAARTAISREMGIVKYSYAQEMILDNFPIQGTITVSDSIFSSGLGGIYPAGLFIGLVEEVKREELNAFCKVKIRPAVNFHSIEELFVLKVGGIVND